MKKLFALATIAATASFMACDNSSSSDDNDNGTSSSSIEAEESSSSSESGSSDGNDSSSSSVKNNESSSSSHANSATLTNEVASCTITFNGKTSSTMTLDAGDYYTENATATMADDGSLSVTSEIIYGKSLTDSQLKYIKSTCSEVECEDTDSSTIVKGAMTAEDLGSITLSEYSSKSCEDYLSSAINVIVPKESYGNDDVTCDAYVMGDTAMVIEYEAENAYGTSHFEVAGDTIFINAEISYPSVKIAQEHCDELNDLDNASCDDDGNSITAEIALSKEEFFQNNKLKDLSDYASSYYCQTAIEEINSYEED